MDILKTDILVLHVTKQINFSTKPKSVFVLKQYQQRHQDVDWAHTKWFGETNTIIRSFSIREEENQNWINTNVGQDRRFLRRKQVGYLRT